VLRNRPFRILLAVIWSASHRGDPGIFLPYYLQYVLGIENWLQSQGFLLVAYFGSGLLSVPGAAPGAPLRQARRLVLALLIGGSRSDLYFLPRSRRATRARPLCVILVWAGAGFGADVPAPGHAGRRDRPDELYTGKRREAQYGALWGIATKFAVIPGAAIPLAALASAGFVPNEEQSETVVETIRGIYGLLPAGIAFAAMYVSKRFPITEAIHRAVLEGVAAHARGESAVDPLTGKSLPPPSGRGLDEDTGWFLDHFTPGELRAGCCAAGDLERDAIRALVIAGLVRSPRQVRPGTPSEGSPSRGHSRCWVSPCRARARRRLLPRDPDPRGAQAGRTAWWRTK
jgi:hypothetical protein